MRRLAIIAMYFIFFGSVGISQEIIIETVDANGANTGSITATIFNAQFDYTFEWTDGDGNLIDPQPFCGPFSCTLSGLNPGQYCVKVTSSGSECDENIPSTAFGCIDVEGVSCNEVLSSFIEMSSPICSNDDSGFIKILFGSFTDACWYDNDIGNMNVEWDNGSILWTQDNQSPGKMCVTVTADQNGSCPDCFAYFCGEIPALEDGPIEVLGNVTNASDCGTDDGTISLSISGGLAPYTVNWIGLNQTGNSAIELSKGVYCAEITDACGNVIVQCFEVKEECCEPLVVNVYTTQHYYCVMTQTLIPATLTVEVSGGSGNYTYQVTNTLNGMVYDYVPVLTSWDWGTYCVIVTDVDCGMQSVEMCATVRPVVYLLEGVFCEPKKKLFELAGTDKVLEEYGKFLSQTENLEERYTIDNSNVSLQRNSRTPDLLINSGIDNIRTLYDITNADGEVIHLVIFNDENHSNEELLIAEQSISRIDIAPNPNSGIFLVEFTSTNNRMIEYSINSVEGKMLVRKTIEAHSGLNNVQLDISELSSGLYFLKLGSEAPKKIIISK